MSGPELIRAGLITKERGLRGELSVKPLTDDPGRFRGLVDVYLEGSGKCRPAVIQNVRYHKGQAIIKFEGCDDADGARLLRGCYISITPDQLIPLEKDRYFVFDLIGCSILCEDGERLGELVDVLETGSNDVYVVRPAAAYRPDGDARAVKDSEDILLPAIKSVILEVDISNKRIVVNKNNLLAT